MPGAGTGPFQGTNALSINPAETAAGSYTDANNVSHGFLRSRNGAITTFDAPGAGSGPGQGTSSFYINPTGAIVGIYIDGNNGVHGFMRIP